MKIPEIDYEALIAACYSQTKQEQGTKGCVQFAKGAEWFRDQMLAAASVASAQAYEVTDDRLAEIADSDECNPDDRGWGPKFDYLKFARAVIAEDRSVRSQQTK